MNVVWPITALYAGPLALWGYYKYGLLSTRHARMTPTGVATSRRGSPNRLPQWSAWPRHTVAPAGAGRPMCRMARVRDWNHALAVAAPSASASWLGDRFRLRLRVRHRLPVFHNRADAGLSPLKGIWAAIKADTLSLVAWQFGMYGWMAIAAFMIFGARCPRPIRSSGS